MPFVQDLRWADKILRIAWFWRLPKRWELSAYYNRPTLYTDDQKKGRIVCLHINEILWFRQRSTDAFIYIYIYIYIRSCNILDSCVQFRYKIQLKGRGENGVLLEIYANCLMGLEIWTENVYHTKIATFRDNKGSE